MPEDTTFADALRDARAVVVNSDRKRPVLKEDQLRSIEDAIERELAPLRLSVSGAAMTAGLRDTLQEAIARTGAFAALEERIAWALNQNEQLRGFQEQLMIGVYRSAAYQQLEQSVRLSLADSEPLRAVGFDSYQRLTFAGLTSRLAAEELLIQSDVAGASLFATRDRTTPAVEQVARFRHSPPDSESESRRARLEEERQAGRLIALDEPEVWLVPTFQLDRRRSAALPSADDAVGEANTVLGAVSDPWAALSWWTAWNARASARPIDLVLGNAGDELVALAESVVEPVG